MISSVYLLTEVSFHHVAAVMSPWTWDALRGCSQKKKKTRPNNERQSRPAGCSDNRPTFFLALSLGSFPRFLPGCTVAQITEETDGPVVRLCPVVLSPRCGQIVRPQARRSQVGSLLGRCIDGAWVSEAETFLTIVFRTVHVSSDVRHSSLKQLPDSLKSNTNHFYVDPSVCQWNLQNMLERKHVVWSVWSWGSGAVTFGKRRCVPGRRSNKWDFYFHPPLSKTTFGDLTTRLMPRFSAVFCLCWEVWSLFSMVVSKWRDDKLLTHRNIFINNIIHFSSTCFMTLNRCQ